MSLCLQRYIAAVIFAIAVVLSLSNSNNINAQTSPPNPTTIPARVTECYAASGSTDFCAQILANTSWAVAQQYAPAIATGAAVFGARPWAGDSREGKDLPKASRSDAHHEQKRAREHLLRGLNGKKEALNFPGWSKSSKRVITSNGRFTYDSWASIVDDDISMFDMASCSKIMATTTAAAQLYQLGFIDLDELVSSERLLGPNFASQGKGQITIRNLLLHNAGFPPDPVPNYNEPQFPCKNNLRYHPDQNFDCVETVYENLLFNQTLVYPTGSKYIYSDLSMITLMFVIAKVVESNNLIAPANFPPVCGGSSVKVRHCPFYAWVWNHVFQRYGLSSTVYVPTDPLRTPPEWESTWHHSLIQGFVSDQNAYVTGGISGHAGVFSTARDAMTFMSIWMDNQDPAMLNETTVQLFTTVYNTTQSSRALGWDTNLGADATCGSLSTKTFFHIGFTGTQFCGDPTTGTITVLLANGRYPNFGHDGMITYRPEYGTLIKNLMN